MYIKFITILIGFWISRHITLFQLDTSGGGRPYIYIPHGICSGTGDQPGKQLTFHTRELLSHLQCLTYR